MTSKNTLVYRSKHISIHAPTSQRAPKAILLLITLSIIYVVCSVTIRPSELFATNSYSFFQGNTPSLETQHETLSEMYTSLERSYTALKNNYMDLRERYNDILVEKSTLLITNQQYISELKELHKKLDSLQGMNEYVCEKLAKQEKEYNNLKFTVDTYLDDYKKHLKDEQDKFILNYQKQMQKQYTKHSQQTKKPYREYFYSSYKKK